MELEDWLQMVRTARDRHGAATAQGVREVTLDTGLAAELLAERATTLSRLGARLDAAVARLAELRLSVGARPRDELVTADDDARKELRDLQWEMVVVKEAMGLRGVRSEVDRTWPLPPPLRLPS